jgi:excisionase family DNA binding protein
MKDHVDFETDVVRLGLPLFLKSKAAAKMMSCGATKLRELIHDGQLEGFRRGKDLLVKTSSVLKFNAGLPRAQFTSPKQSKDIAA